MRWKIYYIDGSEFGNEDGNPEDSPGSGVLAVVQEDDIVGLQTFHQSNFYAFDEQFGGWAGIDNVGLTQYLFKPGLKVIKLGETMSSERYKEMMSKVREDANLPDKSARYPWEETF